jgi:hypothetical protein
MLIIALVQFIFITLLKEISEFRISLILCVFAGRLLAGAIRCPNAQGIIGQEGEFSRSVIFGRNGIEAKMAADELER